MWTALSDPILSLFYPQECHVCRDEVENSEDGVACLGCWNGTKTFDGSETLCNKCGAFLFAGGAGTASCHKCDEHSYDRAVACGMYEKALSASILRLKRSPNASRRLRKLIASTFDRMSIEAPFVVVPVPLSPRR